LALAQVEDYLNQVNKAADDKTAETASPDGPTQPDFDFDLTAQNEQPQTAHTTAGSSTDSQQPAFIFDDVHMPQESFESTDYYDSQLLGLGMSESLPPQEIMEELYVYTLLISNDV
jgi:hypothetical protein